MSQRDSNNVDTAESTTSIPVVKTPKAERRLKLSRVLALLSFKRGIHSAGKAEFDVSVRDRLLAALTKANASDPHKVEIIEYARSIVHYVEKEKLRTLEARSNSELRDKLLIISDSLQSSHDSLKSILSDDELSYI